MFIEVEVTVRKSFQVEVPDKVKDKGIAKVVASSIVSDNADIPTGWEADEFTATGISEFKYLELESFKAPEF